jgi:ABC-type nickel/cobalt efflux system permease component RcnA
MSGIGMIHSTAALFIIACLSLPFFAARFGKLPHQEAANRARKLTLFLRICNFVLIVSLLTGLIRVGWTFSTWVWMVVAIFLAIAALLGIALKTVRTIGKEAEEQQDIRESASKFLRISIMLAIAIIVMVIVKVA